MVARTVRWALALTLTLTATLVVTEKSHAGPLLDWLMGRNRRACYQPVAPACGTCTTTCQQTCQRVVVNYVPYTAYRTQWEQVPVTQYRQFTSTDPCTGCRTTCMRPCTTTTWRMKRVPYTTYRPVYRTETYRVPVTYTTPAPPVGCNSCAVGQVNALPGTFVHNPNMVPGQGVLNTNGNYVPSNSPTPANPNTGVPADNPPTIPQSNLQRPLNRVIASSQKPVPSQVPTHSQVRPEGQHWDATPKAQPINDMDPSKRWNPKAAPPLLNDDNITSTTPAIQRWEYTPVRTASYARTAPVKTQAKQTAVEPVKPKQLSPGWTSAAR